jgi:hypothetical protein
VATSASRSLSALVEHELLDHPIRPPQNRRGIVRPSAFAVLRLLTSSNVVDCSIGSKPIAPPEVRRGNPNEPDTSPSSRG